MSTLIEQLNKKWTEKRIPVEHMNNSLLVNGDSLKRLRDFPYESIDSVVIDGPYGIGFMGKEWDNFNPKSIQSSKYQDGVNHHLQSGRSSSMIAGKYDVTRMGAVKFQEWCYQWAKELIHVMKPGACLVSFCSPRMYHRMATAIEDAGFEIRDQIQYLFGSGFPKSHDISKAIDKISQAERNIICENPNLKGRKTWDNNPKNISLPSSNQAKVWEGWGTGLKPSNEPIVLARKPIEEKTVARNVLKYRTGAINIDDCRIGDTGATKAVVNSKNNKDKRLFDDGISNKVQIVEVDMGRFPSNTIIDDSVAEILKDKAKFFYTPKVSKRERNSGCEHLEAKPQNSEGNQRTYNDRCAVCGKKFTGSVDSRCQCPPGIKKTDKTVYKNKNHHPTVKPIALMEYLVKLVTPPNGICLDIFLGSGSTGIACSNLGFQFIGIEKEPEYYEIAKARMKYWQDIKKVA